MCTVYYMCICINEIYTRLNMCGAVSRWLSVRLETLGALAALAAAVLTVEQRGAASTFGLVLSYALSITMLTSMTVRRALRLQALVCATRRKGLPA